MTAVFAGQWGPEAVLDRTGNVLPGASVTLYDADGTTPSTLWTGRTKATTTPNPFPPDANGNISFFAEPGAHVLAVTVGAAVTRLPITVPVDPHEDQPLDADLAAIAALATTPYGRGFLVLTDASAARGALGLGTAATADATAFDASGAAATVGAAAVHVAGVETVTGAKDFTGGLTKSGVAVETTAGAQTKADVAQAAATTPDATTATKGRVQLAGDLAGTAASPTVPGLAAKAADSAVVHNTGAENVAGVKTFSSAPVVPAGAFPEAAVANLTADLAAKAPVASPTFTGTVTVPAPAGPTDAATKAYVDAVAQGLSVLASVVVLATANVALTGLQTIDGVTLADGNRVLLTGQTTGSQNGPWVAHPGAWTRPADFPSGGTEQGDFVFVESGTANAGSGWVMTGATVVTVDTTGHTWTQFSGAGEILAGTAITKTGNTIAVSLGTGSTQAAAGNDSRLVGAAQKASNLSDLASAATARANLGAAPTLTRTAVKTAAYTAQANEQVPVDTTGGAVPIALVAAPADKSRIAVKLILQDAPGVNWVTITCGGSDVFNRAGGPTTATLKLPSQGLLLDYDAGTGIWTAVADDLPLAALDIRFAPATGSTTYAPVRKTVAQLVAPIYSPHRCGSNTFPENTLLSAQGNLSRAFDFINLDCVPLSDGNLAVVHDTTADRTSTLTGNISSLTTAQWKAGLADVSAWFGPGWGDQPLVTLNDVFATIGTQGTYALEAVVTGAATKIVTLVQRYGLQNYVAIASGSTAELAYVTAAGIQAWLIDGSGATSAATLVAAGISVICLRADLVTQAQVDAYTAAGIKVELHTLTRQATKTKFAGSNVYVWACDEPLYVAGDVTKYRRTTDPFALQAWYPGMVPSLSNQPFTAGTDFPGWNGPDGTGGLSNRGYFLGGNRWGMQNTGAVLQGWACPLANAAGTYSISFTVTYDTVGDTSRWAGCFFAAPTDDSFIGSGPTALNSGYHTILRANGTLELTPIAAGVAGTTQTQATAAIVTGGTATIRIDVTPTSVTVTRTDVGGSNSLTLASAAFRGGYFHFGCSLSSTVGTSKFSWSGVTIA